MNVLLLAQFYPPMIGGEERHVQSLAQALAGRGHRVTVGTLRQQGARHSGWDGAVRVERIPGTVQRLGSLFQSTRRLAPPFPDPETSIAIGRLVSRTRPDVVHAHNWLVYSYLPAALRRERPLVLSLHDYGLICAKKTLVYGDQQCTGPGLTKCLGCSARHYGVAKGVASVVAGWPSAGAVRHAVDLFLPVSTAVAVGNRLAEDGLPYEVIPNFVADDRHVPTPVDAEVLSPLPSGDFILFVGALARRKGVDTLLDAYARLEGAPPLVLIGYRSSDSPARLEDPPRNVSVLTDWPGEAVMEAWRRCSLGVVPSTWADPCPTVAIEAMAAGKPIVASAIGGLPDLVVDKETGVLVPPGDVEGLAVALRDLIADPERRHRMGTAARERYPSYAAEAVVPRVEAAYLRVASRVPGAGTAALEVPAVR